LFFPKGTGKVTTRPHDRFAENLSFFHGPENAVSRGQAYRKILVFQREPAEHLSPTRANFLSTESLQKTRARSRFSIISFFKRIVL
jgi:hypothetical protein